MENDYYRNTKITQKKKINPDYKFDDNDCQLKQNFNKEVYQAYQKINIAVIKADFEILYSL